ncbi:MAG: MATE family efflux transporter [Ruminococcaceae bacterium]|nr:MATE family efflux transporter [Oscillospiraceae bacterium]
MGEYDLFSKIKSLFGAQDMTVGSPTASIIKFAIPLLIGNFAQQLYNTVDAIIVGQNVGDSALAAVGASNPIINLLLALFMGISTGAGIIVSQYFGAKQRENLSKTVGNVIFLTLIVSVVTTALGLLISRPILELMGTPNDEVNGFILEGATTYLMIIMLGFIGTAFYNMVSGILRGMGDSVMPLVFLLVACGINIALDLYFVQGLKWGVMGVAVATIIAQGVSAALCLIRLFTMTDVIDIGLKYFKLDFKLVFQIVRVGLPSGMMQAIFSCATLVVQSLTNTFGEAIIAVTTVVMRVDGFAMMPNFTFGMAMTTFVGQNIGAGKWDRVNKSLKVGLTIGLSTCATLVAAILLFGRNLIGIFSSTPDVINNGNHMLNILAFGYISFCVTQILMGIMRGAGDTVTPMVISAITTVAIRVPVAYLLAFLTQSPELPTGSPESIYWSLLISWVSGTILSVILYLKGGWKKKAESIGIYHD